ncbi:MAG: restriction endonuclease subunit S, partial [Bacteroidota bacterium]|nr:restriction endonuclease subunit S [Bacteroidota bacterium]
MSWKKVMLDEILWFQEGPGVRNTQFRSYGVKLLNVGNINENKVDLNSTKIFISEEEAFGKYKHFLVDSGDLLIASSGITLDTFHKKVAWVKEEHLPLCMNTSTIRFKSKDPSICSLQFFSFFLRTTIFNKQLRKLITGSAQLNFGSSHLKQMWIPLPPLHIQQHIADVLDKADALRQKDQLLLQKYDKLAQSIFYDMFGDPVEYTTLDKVTTKITDGVHFKPNYVDKGVPFISVKNVTKKYLDFSDCKYVSKEDHNEMIK